MDTKIIDERKFVEKFRSDNLNGFYKFVADYDRFIAPIMRSRGYKAMNYAERTVTFTFGTVTFSRRRWYKNGKCKIPVDDKLGLEKRAAHSKELLYQITKLATMMPYRKVVEVIELMYQVYITKDTVLKAIKFANQLLEEKADYRFYQENVNEDKIKAPIIYLEGDGVWIKINEEDIDKRNKEISHFVIHTGVTKHGKRKILSNKKEIISSNNRLAREKVIDYIYNHFEITEETKLISNSDMGHGYTPYIFQEIAKGLKIKHHEHFWDLYHLNKEIRKSVEPYSKELYELFLEAISQHNKKMIRTVLDTLEALVLKTEDEKKLEGFKNFKRRLLFNFKYTAPKKFRRLDLGSLGVMESQHRKISYRMKHRGMYWSLNHVEAMSEIILLSHNQELRDLFYGEWRDDYYQYKKKGMSVAEIRKKLNKVPHSLGLVTAAVYRGSRVKKQDRFLGKKRRNGKN